MSRARVRRSLPLSGADVEVALRACDLIEMLKVLSLDETIVLGVSGPQKPVLVFTGDNYRHTLMPLRMLPAGQANATVR